MHTRCVLQHFRELLSAQAFLDFECCYLTDGHRCLLLAGNLTDNSHVLQHNDLGLEEDVTHVRFGCKCLRGITHVRQLQRCALLHFNHEITVNVGNHAINRAFLEDRHANKRLGCLFVKHCTDYAHGLGVSQTGNKQTKKK